MIEIKKFKEKIRRWNRNRIDRGRSFLLNLFLLIFNGKFVSQKKFTKKSDATQVKNYLVIRTDGKLGDSLFACGFIKHLYDKNQGQVKVYVLTNADTQFIFTKMKGVSVLVYEKSFFTWISLWLELRPVFFETVFLTSHLLKPHHIWLFSFIHSELNLGYGEELKKINSLKIIETFDVKKEHIIKRYQGFLEEIGQKVETSYYQLYLPFDSQVRAEVSEYLDKKKWNSLVIINPFAGGSSRCLTYEAFIYLITTLKEYLNNKIITCLVSPQDALVLKKWKEQSKIDNWELLPSNWTFWHNVEVLKRSELLVTPDTALVHAASVYSVPCLVFYYNDFGADEINSVIWSPFQNEAQIYYLEREPNHSEIEPFMIKKALENGDQSHKLIGRQSRPYFHVLKGQFFNQIDTLTK